MALTFQRDIYKSVLSDASLGIHGEYIPVKERYLGVYTRNGQRIVMLKRQKHADFPRFRLVVDPVKKWFPSRMSNFVFHKSNRRDIEVMVKQVPKIYNASGWISNHDQCYALSVPKDRGEELRKWLYHQGYWHDTKINRWKKFFNHNQQRILRRKANASL